MAKAITKVKRSVVEGEVVLTLTLTEAVVLRSILGSCCSGANTAQRAAMEIFYALEDVPSTVITVANIHFRDESNQSIQVVMERWDPKS